MAEPTVQVTEYTVSVLPDEDINRSSYEIKVAYRGADRWAVLHRSWCLGRSGEWSYESMPSGRTDEWLTEHRFTEAEALERAKWEAPRITVNGLTAAEIQAWAAARRSGGA